MSEGRRLCRSKTRSGDPCGNPPVKGALVCRMHGAGAPQVKRAAARRVAAETALKAAERHAVPVEVDPGVALLQAVHRAAGRVHWLRAQLEDEPPKDVAEWGSRASALWSLLGSEENRLAFLCTAALKAGVEERQVRLAEDQGETLVTVIRGILADLRLTGEQLELVPEVVPRWLRSVAV